MTTPNDETENGIMMIPEKEFRSSRGEVVRNPLCVFGGGAHYCPGRKLATNVAKAFVANLVYNYDIEILGENDDEEHPKAVEHDLARDAFGVLHPKAAVNVRFTKRNSFD